MYVLRKLLLFGIIFTPLLHAQAGPTAIRKGDLQIGAGYSNAQSDYGRRYAGFNIYGDFDFRSHWGVEANFHFVQAPSPGLEYEKTYEIGGRYFLTYGRFVPYAKIMIGRGVFNFPPAPPPASQTVPAANLAYNMYAPGAGVDVRVRPYLNVRGDFEYQQWPGFPPSGLGPSVISIGAAYHFR